VTSLTSLASYLTCSASTKQYHSSSEFSNTHFNSLVTSSHLAQLFASSCTNCSFLSWSLSHASHDAYSFSLPFSVPHVGTGAVLPPPLLVACTASPLYSAVHPSTFYFQLLTIIFPDTNLPAEYKTLLWCPLPIQLTVVPALPNSFRNSCSLPPVGFYTVQQGLLC